MLRRAISQVCRGVVAVHRAISQARGGSLKNYESSAVGESSCPVCNACVPSARWPARRKGRAKRKVRAAGKTQRAGKTQDGRQDARCGQPAKCMRWTRRKVPAAGKMHEVGKTQGAEKARSKENTRRKTTGAARCWAHNPLHESTKKIAPCARILYNTFIRSLAPSHCRVIAPSD